MLSDSELSLITSEGQRLVAAAREDPDREVPQYPGWSLADLASHLGSIHGRTTLICRELPSDRISAPRLPEGTDPIDWCEQLTTEMVEALLQTDPDLQVWAFGPEKTVGFWRRRMLCETGVHRWDAEQAVGEPGALLDAVATHGLDEFAGMYVPQLGELQTLQLVASDLDQSWVYGEGEPTAIVNATASDLSLRLMSRPTAVDLPEDWAEAVDSLAPPPKR